MTNLINTNPNTKRICIVSMSYWGQLQGGAEYQLLLLVTELINKGYKVFYVFVDQEITVQHESLNLIPLKINKLIGRIFYPYQSLLSFDLLRSLRDIKPDIIINRRGDALTGICAYYANRNSCKMIWHVADEPDLTPLKINWRRTLACEYIDKKFLEYGIRNSESIIVQAAYQNDLLQKYYGRSCDVIVPNFHPMPKEKSEKQNPIKIMWIANIKHKKNPDIFLDLAKNFESSTNIRFIMIGREGNPIYQRKIELYSKQTRNFEYKGELPQDEVNQLLCESHIFINTSSYEGFPNTFIQAWMRKVPVVSLNVDPDDVLKNNKIGFHSKTFEQMVIDVRSLFENEELREQMGQRAQKYAFDVHSIQPNVDKIINLISAQKKYKKVDVAR